MWRKILLNALSVGASTYGGLTAAGAPPREAVLATALAIAGNLIGLGQERPKAKADSDSK